MQDASGALDQTLKCNGVSLSNLPFSSPQDKIEPCSLTAVSSAINVKATATFESKNDGISSANVSTTVVLPAIPLGRSSSFGQGNREVSVSVLIERYTLAWCQQKGEFDTSKLEFNGIRFMSLLLKHTKFYTKSDVDYKKNLGFIEKFDLAPEPLPQFFVRADLHGDLKSLIENLRTLRNQGQLDENFKCQPGVHLIFLGDYCDRGQYGTQIIELLALLCQENPQNVHLVRGNHEDIALNKMLCGNDKRLKTILDGTYTSNSLDWFYKTLPLTIYFSINGAAQRQYVQFTHALFEPTMDPASLLAQSTPYAYQVVPKSRQLSERIKLIAESGNTADPIVTAAQRLAQIARDSVFMPIEKEMTLYNWADIEYEDDEPSHLAGFHARRYRLNANDIICYLKLSSPEHRVEMIFRGHGHIFEYLADPDNEEKLIVTTLPIGMNCDKTYIRGYPDQLDRAYIIRTDVHVSNWTKQAILRATSQEWSQEVTSFYPIHSQNI